MDIDLYKESIQYEQITQSIYQSILKNEGSCNIEVKHNVDIKGHSGTYHQIDVLWRFKQAGIEHTVLVECKNYSSNITLEKARNFFGVIHDIGNAQGIIVTKTGYQKGTAQFANYYGIGLKLLRKPNDGDWEGRIKDVYINCNAKMINNDKPVSVNVILKAKDEKQLKHINKLQQDGKLSAHLGASECLLDKDGKVASEEMRCWLPKQLEILDKEDGGPYNQEIELEQKYILINKGYPDEELIQVDKLKITYFVESFSEEIISHGEQIVETILKDFNSNDVEYVKRK